MDLGKTVKQIADELGVSKQAVHQKRKSKRLSATLQPFTTTVDGIVYIAPEGETLLKQAFLKNDTPAASTVADNKFTPVDGNVDGSEHPLYAILRDELAAKNRQLEAKDKQIEQLQSQLAEQTQINKELAQSINADRKNELAGTIREMLPEGAHEEAATVIDAEPAKESGGFWSLFGFRRKK